MKDFAAEMLPMCKYWTQVKRFQKLDGSGRWWKSCHVYWARDDWVRRRRRRSWQPFKEGKEEEESRAPPVLLSAVNFRLSSIFNRSCLSTFKVYQHKPPPTHIPKLNSSIPGTFYDSSTPLVYPFTYFWIWTFWVWKSWSFILVANN